MQLFGTAVGLLQLGFLAAGELPDTSLLDFRDRPIQPPFAMMQHSCPTMPDSTAVAIARERALDAFLSGGEAATAVDPDSMATLACMRIRIGVLAAPPTRRRFLMDRGASWHEGALRVALAQVERTPNHLPTLRALAYSAVSAAFEAGPDGPPDPLRALLDRASAQLSDVATRGVTDPAVLMSCTHLQMFLGYDERAFRCALAGAMTVGDRTWYLTRMAWLLGRARRAEVAKAVLRVAAREARDPANRAELGYLLLEDQGYREAASSATWMDGRIAAISSMAPDDLRAFLLRHQPLGWQWSPARRRSPKPAQCDARGDDRAIPPVVELAQLWQPETGEPHLVAIGRAGSRSGDSVSGTLLLRVLDPERDAALREELVHLEAAPQVVWNLPHGVADPAVVAWSLRLDDDKTPRVTPFGGLEGDRLESPTRLSDMVLLPGAFDLGFDDEAAGFLVFPEAVNAQASALHVYSQINSASGLEGARLELAVSGCESEVYTERLRVASLVLVPAGLSEFRRIVNLEKLEAGEYQLRLSLISADGEVVSVKERSFRVDQGFPGPAVSAGRPGATTPTSPAAPARRHARRGPSPRCRTHCRRAATGRGTAGPG